MKTPAPRYSRISEANKFVRLEVRRDTLGENSIYTNTETVRIVMIHQNISENMTLLPIGSGPNNLPRGPYVKITSLPHNMPSLGKRFIAYDHDGSSPLRIVLTENLKHIAAINTT